MGADYLEGYVKFQCKDPSIKSHMLMLKQMSVILDKNPDRMEFLGNTGVFTSLHIEVNCTLPTLFATVYLQIYNTYILSLYLQLFNTIPSITRTL